MLIIPLTWKDDSFRSTLWVSNPVSASTNGDEITLLNGVTVTRQSGVNIKASSISAVDVKARKVSSNSTLTINLFDINGVNRFTQAMSLTTSFYTFFNFPTSIANDIHKIQLVASGSIAVVDFVAVETTTSPGTIDFTGDQLTINYDTKTTPQPIPFSFDVIQQLGIQSRSVTVTSPKLPITIYNSLESMVTSNTMILFKTINQQATGYITDIQRTVEAGTVPVLYDMTVSLIKADSPFQ